MGAGWEEWIFRGEKGVWEVGGYIRAKCAVEITLDHCISLGGWTDLVYSMLQMKGKEEAGAKSWGEKETETVEEGWKQWEERGRAKSFGTGDEARLIGELSRSNGRSGA
jgi:hypothetical protein